jgi:hypothetical protein
MAWTLRASSAFTRVSSERSSGDDPRGDRSKILPIEVSTPWIDPDLFPKPRSALNARVDADGKCKSDETKGNILRSGPIRNKRAYPQ